MLKWDGLWGFLCALIRVMTLCLISLIPQCFPVCLHLPCPTFPNILPLTLPLCLSSSTLIQELRIHSKCQWWGTWNAPVSEYINNLVTRGFGFLMWQIQLSRVCYHDHSPTLPRCIQSNLINAGRAFTVWEVFVSPKLRGGICPGHDSRYLFL